MMPPSHSVRLWYQWSKKLLLNEKKYFLPGTFQFTVYVTTGCPITHGIHCKKIRQNEVSV
jgi:hypothetical protein